MINAPAKFYTLLGLCNKTMLKDFTDIKGYEGLYAINKLGQIWSYPKYRWKGRFIKPFKCSKGYLKIHLTKNKKIKLHSIHRLLLQTFIPNPENKPESNHKNGIKDDNRLENLEWVTGSENMKHAFRTGLKVITEKQKKRMSKLGKRVYYTNGIKARKPIVQYNRLGFFIQKFNSITQASQFTGIGRRAISNCLRGLCHNAGGYKWKYLLAKHYAL